MSISRRRLFQSVVVAGGFAPAVEGAEPSITLEVVRDAAVAHGTHLSEERLRVLKPVLEHSLPQLRALRDFDLTTPLGRPREYWTKRWLPLKSRSGQ